MRYMGWVPTAVGRLSFSHIATGLCSRKRNRKLRESQLLTHEDDVLLVGYQIYKTGDHTRSDPGERAKGIFNFLLVGERPGENSNIDQPFSGRLFSLPSDYDMSWVQRAVDAPGRVNDVAKSICNQLSASALADLEFVLHRDGVVEFSVQNAVASEGWAGEDNNDRWMSCVNQHYFVFKEIVHTHKHHDSEDDQTLHVYPVSGDGRDLEWARNVLFELYRSVVGFNRAGSKPEFDYTQALGFLAYAQSFTRVIEQRRAMADAEGVKVVQFPEFFSDQLAQSLAASRDAALMRTQTARSNTLQSLALVVGVVAVFWTFLQTLGQYKQSDVHLASSGKMFAHSVSEIVADWFLWVAIGPTLTLVVACGLIRVVKEKRVKRFSRWLTDRIKEAHTASNLVAGALITLASVGLAFFTLYLILHLVGANLTGMAFWLLYLVTLAALVLVALWS
jgi:hypothetical protein